MPVQHAISASRPRVRPMLPFSRQTAGRQKAGRGNGSPLTARVRRPSVPPWPTAIRNNPFAWAGHLALWSRRLPNARMGLLYGASYDRRLFDALGFFREDLRAGEDSEFNRPPAAQPEPKWRRRVHTLHRQSNAFASRSLPTSSGAAPAPPAFSTRFGDAIAMRPFAWLRRTDRALRASRQVDTRYRAYVWLARPLIPFAVAAYCVGARSWQRRNQNGCCGDCPCGSRSYRTRAP